MALQPQRGHAVTEQEKDEDERQPAEEVDVERARQAQRIEDGPRSVRTTAMSRPSTAMIAPQITMIRMLSQSPNEDGREAGDRLVPVEVGPPHPRPPGRGDEQGAGGGDDDEGARR